MKKYLNVGCGRRYRLGDWTNIDMASDDPNVTIHDITRGLPSPDGSFEVVYHSHVLEHFTRTDGLAFLRECQRVLAPGGIIRIAVPDLEGVTRAYLAKLDAVAEKGDAEAADYDWMMLELYDQVLRNRSGGEMQHYLSAPEVPNRDFIVQRLGTEARVILNEKVPSPAATNQTNGTSLLSKIGKTLSSPDGWRRALRRLVLGRDVALYDIGAFRTGGEVHQWMYDRYSLKRSLGQAGFGEIVQRDAQTSYVAGWADYHLDTEENGEVYKPDSLFMEGRKPAG